MNDTGESDFEFLSDTEKIFDELNERKSHDYDGVLGLPPEWVPDWAVSFLQHYRNRLLDVREYTHSDLLKLIEQYKEEFFRENYFDKDEVSNFRYHAAYPNGRSIDQYCFKDEIGFLAWLKWCVDQGEETCLAELSGKDGVLGFQRRQQLANFGAKRAKDIQNERIPEWEKWNKEADNLKKLNPHIANNKSELARRIIKNLNLTESINTVRQRI